MKRKLLLFFLLLFLLIFRFNASSEIRFTIRGQIFDKEYHTPIIGAFISIDSANTSTTTDLLGRFEIKNLSRGLHILNVSSLGFSTRIDSINLEQNQDLFITLLSASINLSEITVASGKGNTQSLYLSDIDKALRPLNSAQDLLKMVPGLFIAQHAGGGKAEQIFLRGFDCDHGTDFYISVDGMPVNMVSHAHGQGYADFHFVIPETIDRMRVYKGPYTTRFGDFSTSGTGEFFTKNSFEKNELKIEAGMFDTYRSFLAINLLKEKHVFSQEKENAFVAGEYVFTNSYFDQKQNFIRYNLFSKYSGWINKKQFLSLDISTFGSSWNASGQIPERSVKNKSISRFGSIDPSEGGRTSRSNVNTSLTSLIGNNYTLKNQLYFVNYYFDLFSNFTFFLNDPVHGDEIHQKDERTILGYLGTLDKSFEIGSVPVDIQFGLGSRNDFSTISLFHSEKRTTLETIVSGKMEEQNVNTYLNAVVHLSNKLAIETGSRLDYFNFSFADDRGKSFSGTKNITRVSPKMNINYSINRSLQFFIRSGFGFHSNDARAVVLNQTVNTLPKAFGYEAGSEFLINKNILVHVALWSLHLERELVYIGDEGSVETNYPTQRYGTDLSIRYQLSSKLFADIDCNLSHGKLLGAAIDENKIPLAPRITSIGGLTYKQDRGLNAGLRFRSIDSRPANESNSVSAKGYFLFDALIRYQWPALSIGVTVENVLNTEWNQAQFDTESRLINESVPVSELHFTPGSPAFVKAQVSYLF